MDRVKLPDWVMTMLCIDAASGHGPTSCRLGPQHTGAL